MASAAKHLTARHGERSEASKSGVRNMISKYLQAIFFITSFLMITNVSFAGPFPKNFKWCTATSAHQIEGDNVSSDWWTFEQQEGRIARGDKSENATDHWNRVDQDIALMKNLGVNTYRMSIEWAKIEPTQGAWDQNAIAHYRDELRKLRASGIEPLVTLHHFTLPQWVADNGGLEWSGFSKAFSSYVQLVYTQLGVELNDIVTFNEPMVLITFGYLDGSFPPQKKDPKAAARAFKNVVKAHADAYHLLHHLAKKENRKVRVGLAHHLHVFQPYWWLNPMDRLVAGKADHLINWAFIDAVETGHAKAEFSLTFKIDEYIPSAKGTQDFFGVNYYTRTFLSFSVTKSDHIVRSVNADAAKSDLGWEIYPEGLYLMLKKISKNYTRKPIIITENGLADAKDTKRAKFIYDHLLNVQKAIKEDVPVEGYCHWSLLDNFEWAEGFHPRFGLYEVDYVTFDRLLRRSAQVFAGFAKSNSIP
jgi:beta-glucosidase